MSLDKIRQKINEIENLVQNQDWHDETNGNADYYTLKTDVDNLSALVRSLHPVLTSRKYEEKNVIDDDEKW
jgi:hypothetical protein